MPDRPTEIPTQASVSEGLRLLLEEQLRLRSDVERLLKQQQELLKKDQAKSTEKPSEQKNQNQQNNGGPPKQGDSDKEKESGKGADNKGDKDNKGDEDSKGGNGDQESEPKPPLKQRVSDWVHAHPVGFVLILAGAVVLVIAGFFLWLYLDSYVNTDDAEIDGHIHQVSSRIAGTVIGVYVENNRNVEQRETLADLDPRDYTTALAQANANLAQAIGALQAQEPNVPITQTNESTNAIMAHFEVGNAEAALVAARQRHQAALADLSQAQANAANAAAEEQRYRRLADKQEVSREIYDQRATEARAQAAIVASRRAAADAAEKAIEEQARTVSENRERERQVAANLPRQVSVQHAALTTREANVEAAKAQVTQAGLNLSYCKILAPVSGIVGDKTVEVGQQVAPGQELLAITGTEDLWVTANFKETQIQRMHPGQAVTIHVDAIDLKFDGYVQNMAGATGARYSLLPPENATGNYVKVVQRLPVRIRFKPGQPGFDRLRPGMSVEPKVWLK